MTSQKESGSATMSDTTGTEVNAMEQASDAQQTAETSYTPSETEALPMMVEGSTPTQESQVDSSVPLAYSSSSHTAWLAAPAVVAALAAGAMVWWRKHRGD